MKAIEKLKEFIITKLSSDEQNALKNFVAPAIPVKMADINAKDSQGKDYILTYEGEILNTNMSVMDITSGTPAPAMDEEYTLADGTVITVMNGLVSELETPDAASAETEIQKKVDSAVSAQMSKHNTKYDELKSANIKLSEQVVLLNKVVNEMLEAPVAGKVEAEKQKIEKSYDEMTKREQYLFNRGKL